MITSNKEVFAILDHYCSVRGDPVQNSHQDRWIATERRQQAFLKYSILSETIVFSPTRSIARLDLETQSYFITLGFEHVSPFGALDEIDLNGSILTTLVALLRPRPRASTPSIREYIEALDKSIPGYTGHDFNLIADLFPPIKCFKTNNVSNDETWRIFFLLCIDECRQNESWIDHTLADTLQSMCELQFLHIPFRMLCRSIFDSDPATMFLALYRCLESLYAYTSAEKIIQALGLTQSWAEVATALEDKLDWHPREESSLADLLSKALNRDLSELFVNLGEARPPAGNSTAAAAGRRIYRLRNGLVHFRPYHHNINRDPIDWNGLCTTMALLVWHIYSDVFAV